MRPDPAALLVKPFGFPVQGFEGDRWDGLLGERLGAAIAGDGSARGSWSMVRVPALVPYY